MQYIEFGKEESKMFLLNTLIKQGLGIFNDTFPLRPTIKNLVAEYWRQKR